MGVARIEDPPPARIRRAEEAEAYLAALSDADRADLERILPKLAGGRVDATSLATGR